MGLLAHADNQTKEMTLVTDGRKECITTERSPGFQFWSKPNIVVVGKTYKISYKRYPCVHYLHPSSSLLSVYERDETPLKLNVVEVLGQP